MVDGSNSIVSEGSDSNRGEEKGHGSKFLFEM